MGATCSMVSVVMTQKMTGTPESRPALSTPLVAALTTASKCAVAPLTCAPCMTNEQSDYEQRKQTSHGHRLHLSLLCPEQSLCSKGAETASGLGT